MDKPDNKIMIMSETHKNKLIDLITSLKYKRRKNSDANIYDFVELLIRGPVEKSKCDFTTAEDDLVKRLRVFFINNDLPFTVIEDGDKWRLGTRKIRK